MRGFLRVVLDWTPRDGVGQHWLSRRTFDFTRIRVKGTGRPWEVEFYADVMGNISVRDANSGEVLWETRLSEATS